MEKAPGYISNLTPLRGVAALLVFLLHFQALVTNFIFPSQTHFFELSYLMVDLFFIMSGFIILHVYGSRFSTGMSVRNFSEFTLARFARIYPLHLFTLVVLIIFAAIANAWGPIFDPKAIPANILLIHSFGLFHIFTWNVPSWSISAEWWAYMIFPLIVLFLSKNKRLAILTLIPLIVLTYCALMYWLPRKNYFVPNVPVPHNLDITFDYGYIRGMAGFVTGMLAYELYQSRLLANFFQKDLVALLVVLGTIYLMHVKINDGICILLFALVVLCFACNDGRLQRLCNFRFAQFIGDISYSIYLIQTFLFVPFLSGLRLPLIKYGNAITESKATFWVGLMYFAIFLVVIIGLSTLSYIFIEVPCRKWLNGKWKKPRPAYAPLA
ncbi:MAG: hypothetical protein C5B59_20255 [Bacteroidetes bacterium]|nr:MAG: hypothetical protein C5B59_20255 [Bacteroidota bacterium]